MFMQRDARSIAVAFPLAARILAGELGSSLNHFSAPGYTGMTPQQQVLHQKFCWYSNAQYDNCVADWLGAPLQNQADVLAKALVPKNDGVPPGFRSMGIPFAKRRPVAPTKLVRRVVNRFTAQLFGDQMAPVLRVLGDEKTQHWLSSFASTSRLWAAAQMARNLGGAMGTVAMGYKVVDGEPRIEIFDPRLSRPVWKDRESRDLKALDERYEVPVTVNPKALGAKGEPFVAYYWVRRLVSDQADIRYKPVWKTENLPTLRIGELIIQASPPPGEEPQWERLIDEDASVVHNLGECPIVWIQNLPVHGSEYGEEDCEDLYPQVADLDQMRSSISTATKANMDPTLVITSPNGKFPSDIRKGSGNGIGLEPGSIAQYLEITGAGITVAQAWYEKMLDGFYDDAECIASFSKLDGPPQTATEVIAKLGPMLDKVARLREQYGQHGVRRLLEKVIRAAPKLDIRLEPRVVEVRDGEDIIEEVTLGPKAGLAYVRVDWPPIVRPTPQDTTSAGTAASAALQGGVIDKQAAAEFAAPFFGVKDVGEMIGRMKRDAEEAEAKAQQVGGQLEVASGQGAASQ